MKKPLTTTLSVLAALVLGLAVPATASDETMHIDTPSRVTLTADHHGPILITADDVVLDCDRHQVVGPGYGEGITLDGVSGVVVQNCRVRDFGIGIFVRGGGEHRLERNKVWDNTDSQIRLVGSDGNAIRGNEAVGGAFGIILFASGRNSIRENTVEDAEWIAFGLEEGSNENEVTGNEASGDTATMFSIVPSHRNVLKGNVAVGGTHGFFLAGATENELIGNTSVNVLIGFALLPLEWDDVPETGSHDNILKANTASFYTANGFQVIHSNRTTLTDNEASGGAEAFFLLHASDGLIRANRASLARVGFWIGQSSGLEASFNESNGNTEYGFLATELSHDNLLHHNRACDNGTADARDDEPGPPNTWEHNEFCTPLSFSVPD